MNILQEVNPNLNVSSLEASPNYEALKLVNFPVAPHTKSHTLHRLNVNINIRKFRKKKKKPLPLQDIFSLSQNPNSPLINCKENQLDIDSRKTPITAQN